MTEEQKREAAALLKATSLFSALLDEELAALALLTIRLVREDRRFQRIGPRAWRLIAPDDTGGVRSLRQ